MNIIFLNSVYNAIPQRSVGPYLLKHYINKRGYTSQVIDYCQDLTATEIFNYLKKFTSGETLCIGVSTTLWFDEQKFYYSYDNGPPPNIGEALKMYRSEYPNIKIILGGAHSGYINKRIEYVDAVFIGESEDVLVEYLEHLRTGSETPPSTLNVFTKKRVFQYPNKKLYDIGTCDFQWTDQDCVVDGETLPLETSRGCIFKCKFCAYPHLGKKKFDYLKPVHIIKEHLEHNWNKYRVKNYIMLDDTFNDSEYKIDGFLKMRHTLTFDLNYAAYIRADLVHRFDGMAEKLYESGLRSGFFGIESISPSASTLIGKGWSGRDGVTYVPRLINEIWQKKVHIISGIIVGLPGESPNDLYNTLEWANNNMLNVVFFGLGVTNNLGDRPFVSEFERNASDYGFKFDKNGHWYTDQWTKASAAKLSAELNLKRKNNRIGSFNYIAIKNLDVTDEEINTTHRLKLIEHNPVFFERKKIFINRYKDKLNNL